MQPVACAGCQALQRRLPDLQAENERLCRQLDEATRAGKRQAAHFAKGQLAAQPKKPGRKPGKDYGTKAHRQAPTPDQIDEVHEAPLPDRCPDCGGPVYGGILRSVGKAEWVVPDETGWRVGGNPAWLHALVAPEATAYVI